MPENNQRRKSRWFDEVSPAQYKYPGNAVIRREILEYSLDGMDFHGNAFRALNLNRHDRILNVGTGDGRDEVRLALDPQFDHQGEIIGVDIPDRDEDFDVRFYRALFELQRVGKDNVKFCPGNAMALPFEDESFDVVMWINSGYHFADVIAALMESHRVLKRGGKFLNLTNAAGNKVKQHELVSEIRGRLGDSTHQPFSSRFDMQTSQKVIPFFFEPIYEGVERDIEQNTYYGITEDTSPILKASVDSYRASAPDSIRKGWIPARDDVFAERVYPVITQGHVWIDRLHRGGGGYEKTSHEVHPLKRRLGRVALEKIKYKKERPS